MAKRSAGILMFRRRGADVEVLLMHPGGPFWAKKDNGVWSIAKGEYLQGEDALAVAKREFEEETGAHPQGEFLPLGDIVQAGRKIVTAWGLEGDFDPATLVSNRFELEWPPKSGRKASLPEVESCAVVFARRGPAEDSACPARAHQPARRCHPRLTSLGGRRPHGSEPPARRAREGPAKARSGLFNPDCDC